MGYYYGSEIFAGILSGLFAAVPSGLIAIATYVLSAMALYTIATRRGLKNPWLAWIPVANNWLVGSVSDQYRYVVRRERKSKRVVLLTLSIIRCVLGVIVLGQVISIIGHGITGILWDYSESRIMEEIMGTVIDLLTICLPLSAVAIAYAVVRFMALFDIYKSLDPNNSVLYLVLSIFIGVTEPFFLFFNRNKDDGMPPRKRTEQPSQDPPSPEWQPTQNRPDPWEQGPQENKDYL